MLASLYTFAYQASTLSYPGLYNHELVSVPYCPAPYGRIEFQPTCRYPMQRRINWFESHLVDDDPQELRYVRDTLVNAGYRTVVTGDPEEAVRLMQEERPRLALLDLVLPGTDGIELMRTLLRIADLPVIFLSAYGRDDTIARAFEMGAVDYVVKPFSPTELAARIGAALRRGEVAEPLEPYVRGGLVIDYALHRVSVDGQPVPLTTMEYRTLAELAANAGRVLTYQHLLERVWREPPDAEMSPMRTMVAKLRTKLGEGARNPRYLFTEARVGYWMPREETPAESLEPRT